MAGALSVATLSAAKDENGTGFREAAAAAGYPSSSIQVALSPVWSLCKHIFGACVKHHASLSLHMLKCVSHVARPCPQDILARTDLVGKGRVHAFVELHIEQGPELEAKVHSFWL